MLSNIAFNKPFFLQFQSLPVVHSLSPVYPESGQFGEYVDDLECFQVVDEDVRHPKTVDQLQVH